MVHHQQQHMFSGLCIETQQVYTQQGPALQIETRRSQLIQPCRQHGIAGAMKFLGLHRHPKLVRDPLYGIDAARCKAGAQGFMSCHDRIDGALQRLMFALAYLWYAREAWPSGSETDSRLHLDGQQAR